MKKINLIAIGLLINLILFEHDTFGQFNISAEIRPRGIIDNGAGNPLIDTMDTRYYGSQRTRLTFDFQKSIFQMRLTAQDVRVWGSGDIYTGTGVFGSTSGLDFHEAWLKINIKKNASVTVGRQELSYDNQRLLSERNWNQFGLVYDAVLLALKHKNWYFDMAVSYNNGMNYTQGKPDFNSELYFNTNLIKTLNFLRINKSFGENINSSLFALATGYTNEFAPDVIYLTGTYGFYTHFSFEHFELPVDAYYQNGKAQSGKEVSAFAAGLNPGVNIGPVKFAFGASYLSGDDANNANFQEKERTFNKFYGSGFRYHGWMNHYVYIKGNTNSGGLVDLFPSLAWKISPYHKMDIQTHFFSLAHSVLIEGMIINNKDLGTEFDTRYTFTFNEEFNFNVGFSYYLTTETFELVKGGHGVNIRQPFWIWTMLTYTPEIFSK